MDSRKEPADFGMNPVVEVVPFEMVEFKGVRERPVEPSLGAYDSKALSDATALDTGEATLVQQHFAHEADINTIMQRFGSTGEMPLGPSGPAVYGDFSGITDYESALATVQRVNDSFMQMPPEVRERFRNSPAELIRWAQTASPEEVDALSAVPESAPEAPVT